MVTVTGLTAERMQEMEDATVVSGHVSGSNLILVTNDGTEIDAGIVAGPVGPAGGAFIICTSTTRPTLTAPEAGKAIYETDTGYIRVWTGTRWKLQERIICTSSSRPSGLGASDEGVKIYETDTNLEWVWTGSTWRSMSFDVNVQVYADIAERNSLSPSPAPGAVSATGDTPGMLWVFAAGVWNIVGDPPGTMSPYFGATAPPGHVLMYGQTIIGADVLYPVLWSRIHSSFKSGSNLIVPDMRGRVAAGKDDMGGSNAARLNSLSSATLGAQGGSQSVQQHTHGIVQTPHSHTVGETLVGSGPYGVTDGGKAISLVTQGANANITLQDYGTGNSGNVQPTMIVNWILKVL